MLAPFSLRRRSIAGIWIRHAIVLLRNWRIALTWFFVEPAIILVAVGLGIGQMVGEVGSSSYAAFVTPGLIIGASMFHAIFECSWSTFQRIEQRVLHSMLTTPVSVTELAVGEVLLGTTRAAISTLALGAFALALGWLAPSALPGVLLAAILIGLLFGSIGLIFAALSPTTSVLSLVFTLVATPLYFFCGAFFPISILPDWIEPIAWAAPLTPGVHLARGFAEGQLDIIHLGAVIYMVLLIVLFFLAANRVLQRRLVR